MFSIQGRSIWPGVGGPMLASAGTCKCSWGPCGARPASQRGRANSKVQETEDSHRTGPCKGPQFSSCQTRGLKLALLECFEFAALLAGGPPTAHLHVLALASIHPMQIERP